MASKRLTVEQPEEPSAPGSRPPGSPDTPDEPDAPAAPSSGSGAEADAEPAPLPAWIELPEPLSYRIKNKLLGPPLATEQLVHERLGKPTALAVFASDNLSSVSYGTEEILRHLVPYVGLAAFALVTPITIALLVVLAFLVLSYRQTIKAYPSAGGAYIVTRDNFGVLAAQVAGVALLIDYVLTVAVSVAAGTAAIASAASSLQSETVPLSLVFIALIAYGNLRGVRESGRVFAVPTYFFLATMAVLLGVGVGRAMFGSLPVETIPKPGMVPLGHKGDGMLMGAGLFVVLRAFASGGAAVTGVEAISNGVSAFKPPEWRNARQTLVIMASTLGVMFLGLSFLSARTHVVPYVSGTPTVLSQVGRLAFGSSPVGQVLYYCLQAGTTLILVLAANTSFADFPRLASFHAADDFMPRPLTKRGHRLVYSNGIISLAVAAGVLVVITGARVDALIPLYAIGVFLSFTFSQAGMAKRHITRKEPGWRLGFFINATGAVMTAIVEIIIAVTKFKPQGTILGSWVVIVLVPLMVTALVRLHRRYEAEAEALREEVPERALGPIPRHHVVYVLVETIDEPTARAFQYARTLRADELRALHVDVDRERTARLMRAWSELGWSEPVLEVVTRRDGRIDRGARDVVASLLADGETEVTVLVPRNEYGSFWERFRSNRTAGSVAATLSTLPRCDVGFVPYAARDAAVARGATRPTAPMQPVRGERATRPGGDGDRDVGAADVVPIGSVHVRQRVRVLGRVDTVRVRSRAHVPTLECVLRDGTGGITVVFLGRRHIPGIEVGARLLVEGVVADYHGRLAILNPTYQILPRDTVPRA